LNTIKTLRNKLNLKQTEFAALLGATEQSVVNWENDKNKNKLKKSTLNLIAKTFNVSPAWLLTGEGEMFSSAAAPIDAKLLRCSAKRAAGRTRKPLINFSIA
jgi:transcriptional regulator with XRE-family HTH domain